MPTIIADVGFTLIFDSVEEMEFAIDVLRRGIVEVKKHGEEPPYHVGFYLQEGEPPQSDNVFEPSSNGSTGDKKHLH